VQKLRIRYAKRGRLRFTSHRDFARAFERAIRRAELPIAYSAGFNPHPKVSYAGAAPTGVASEAEYLEIGLAQSREPASVRDALDGALPPGIDILDVMDAATSQAKSLNDVIEASVWRIVLPDVPESAAGDAVAALLAVESAPVERPTKDGTRTVDVRAAILSVEVSAAPPATGPIDAADPADPTKPQMNAVCATLDVVVRHATPAVRPDDILTALRTIGALTTPVTPVVTRLAQGLLDETSPEDAKRLIDPFGVAGKEPAPEE
jgi:radical SAM-linked protein